MQTFEYKTILISEDENPIPILNAEGQNGWEVIFIENDYCHRIWMKRKLDKEFFHGFSNLRKAPYYRDFLPKRNP